MRLRSGHLLKHLPQLLPLLAAVGTLGVFTIVSTPFLPARAQTPYPYQANVQQLGGYQQASDDAENVLIILDSSYSMSDKLKDGNVKMVAAKRAIMQVLQNLPPNVNAALRVYGQSDGGFSACNSTELLVPFGQNNRNLIASKLLKLKPTGATPISHTLVTALNHDFRNTPGKKSIILVSDGMETCSADPCTVAVEMVRKNVDVKINVVGFGLSDMDAEKQLKCVALSTKGKFVHVDTEAQLAETLKDLSGAKTNVQGRIFLPKPTSNPVTPTQAAPANTPPLEEKMLEAIPAQPQKL